MRADRRLPYARIKNYRIPHEPFRMTGSKLFNAEAHRRIRWAFCHAFDGASPKSVCASPAPHGAEGGPSASICNTLRWPGAKHTSREQYYSARSATMIRISFQVAYEMY